MKDYLTYFNFKIRIYLKKNPQAKRKSRSRETNYSTVPKKSTHLKHPKQHPCHFLILLDASSVDLLTSRALRARSAIVHLA